MATIRCANFSVAKNKQSKTDRLGLNVVVENDASDIL